MKINYTNKHYVRVRYAETDKMGYCYYGNYASFLEIGRVESLRSLGISYKSLEDNGIMLPVSEFQIKYFSPAYYDDMLLIETKITAIEGVRIYFDYFIYNDNQKLIASAMTILVFIDAISKKPVPPPKELLSIIQSYAIQEQ
ncbi:MAG: acyl-CoA thioesterase [Crocinitomicaceae bacterium]|jgi:acyl-CoA thioester hydrolase|nr:acyl-CoA thioesterase [Crocinitomicaceae bacterium]